MTRDGDMTVPTRCKLLLLFERRFFNLSSAVVCTDVKLHLETVNRFPSEVQGDKVIAIRLLSPKEGTGGKWGPMPSAISFHFISFSSFPELHLVYSTSRFLQPIGESVHRLQIEMSKTIKEVEEEGVEWNWIKTTWRITEIQKDLTG